MTDFARQQNTWATTWPQNIDERAFRMYVSLCWVVRRKTNLFAAITSKCGHSADGWWSYNTLTFELHSSQLGWVNGGPAWPRYKSNVSRHVPNEDYHTLPVLLRTDVQFLDQTIPIFRTFFDITHIYPHTQVHQCCLDASAGTFFIFTSFYLGSSIVTPTVTDMIHKGKTIACLTSVTYFFLLP